MSFTGLYTSRQHIRSARFAAANLLMPQEHVVKTSTTICREVAIPSQESIFATSCPWDGSAIACTRGKLIHSTTKVAADDES